MNARKYAGIFFGAAALTVAGLSLHCQKAAPSGAALLSMSMAMEKAGVEGGNVGSTSTSTGDSGASSRTGAGGSAGTGTGTGTGETGGVGGPGTRPGGPISGLTPAQLNAEFPPCTTDADCQNNPRGLTKCIECPALGREHCWFTAPSQSASTR
jgi:hypothetical protein